eukprot:TRINITY_DN7275_c0_g1_i2.p1 TRINITY_DN7275_c0_g1~~TRINITY_DN7275_c0_g1_i2.p1  ORF type:complete len:274 (+),score=63.32 TRINITY_DN7275_c0_g1_i2:64-885(+)
MCIRDSYKKMKASAIKIQRAFRAARQNQTFSRRKKEETKQNVDSPPREEASLQQNLASPVDVKKSARQENQLPEIIGGKSQESKDPFRRRGSGNENEYRNQEETKGNLGEGEKVETLEYRDDEEEDVSGATFGEIVKDSKGIKSGGQQKNVQEERREWTKVGVNDVLKSTERNRKEMRPNRESKDSLRGEAYGEDEMDDYDTEFERKMQKFSLLASSMEKYTSYLDSSNTRIPVMQLHPEEKERYSKILSGIASHYELLKYDTEKFKKYIKNR